MPNRLAAATSPYLLQHQHNPVDWREWGPDALAEAADRDVPILLSVGYAACHWCHVMAHESFENDAIADAMNANFVNVKVDREERPDVDQVFQHALALLGQQGGWPLTMFLTPAGEPFWGGTYFPPDARYGRVGFPDVLATLDRLWRKERDRALGNRDALKDALAALERVADPVALPSDLVAQSAARLAQAFDRSHGGLGGAPKFPQPVLLELLWREGLGSDDRTPATAALVSLEHMARGGIYDHVAGGFARYSVDAEWRVPHFEKMLYDNALLLDLYAEAWARTDRPLYRRTAEGIVAWLLAEMRVDGGFAASLDADSEGEEGRFYVWSADEVRDLLGADADRFAAAFDVRDDGNWEGTNVLNRLTDGDLDDPAHEARIREWLEILHQRRAARVRPGLDDKVLADWNGMMIAALARAGQLLEEPAWIEAAAAAFAEVVDRLGNGDRLAHSYRDGRRLDLGFLDDHVQMARSAAALFAATGNAPYRDHATTWIATAFRDYRDDTGAFRPGPADGRLPVASRWQTDGPTPSPIGTLATVCAQLWHLTADTDHARDAQSIIDRYAGEIARNPAGYASLMLASAWLREATLLVLTGDGAAVSPLGQTVRRHLPGFAIRVDGDPYVPISHPAHGKTAVGGQPTLYVCRDGTCRPPVVDAANVAEALS